MGEFWMAEYYRRCMPRLPFFYSRALRDWNTGAVIRIRSPIRFAMALIDMDSPGPNAGGLWWRDRVVIAMHHPDEWPGVYAN